MKLKFLQISKNTYLVILKMFELLLILIIIESLMINDSFQDIKHSFSKDFQKQNYQIHHNELLPNLQFTYSLIHTNPRLCYDSRHDLGHIFLTVQKEALNESQLLKSKSQSQGRSIKLFDTIKQRLSIQHLNPLIGYVHQFELPKTPTKIKAQNKQKSISKQNRKNCCQLLKIQHAKQRIFLTQNNQNLYETIQKLSKQNENFKKEIQNLCKQIKILGQANTQLVVQKSNMLQQLRQLQKLLKQKQKFYLREKASILKNQRKEYFLLKKLSQATIENKTNKYQLNQNVSKLKKQNREKVKRAQTQYSWPEDTNLNIEQKLCFTDYDKKIMTAKRQGRSKDISTMISAEIDDSVRRISAQKIKKIKDITKKGIFLGEKEVTTLPEAVLKKIGKNAQELNLSKNILKKQNRDLGVSASLIAFKQKK